MGGIPNEPYCGICESLGTIPPKSDCKTTLDYKLVWCKLHQRRLLLGKYKFPDPNPEPSISSTVCSKFTSVYTPGIGCKQDDRKSPMVEGDGPNYLWRIESTRAHPFWVFEPLIKFDELPGVDPLTGELV